MNLIRHRYFGENFENFFEFSMLSGEAVIGFTVGRSVLDIMDGVSDTVWDQRDEQFLRLRDRIEAVAARRFLVSPPMDRMTLDLSAADFGLKGF
jgi:hypothetical protein